MTENSQMSTSARQRPLIADVMRALRGGPEDQRGDAMKLDRIGGALDPDNALYDEVRDASLGAQELGLVTGVGDPDSWHEEAFLTTAGRSWAEEDPLPQIHYSYLVNNELTVGTLSDWAKLWEGGQYSSDIHVSRELRTWNSTYGVAVDRIGETEEGDIDYRIWAAGETASVRIDGRS